MIITDKTPEDFGAIGDGETHPLSQRYATIAAARAVYPFVTSLTQEIDWAALQSAVYQHGRLSTTGERFVPGVVPLRPGAVYAVKNSLHIGQSYVKVLGNFATIINTGVDPTILIDHDRTADSPCGVGIRDLYLSWGGGNAIVARSAPQIEIDSVFIKSHSGSTAVNVPYAVFGHGIELAGCVSSTISRCGIDRTGGMGIYVHAYVKVVEGLAPVICESQLVRVLNNRVYHTDSIGILLSEGGGMRAEGNDIESCRGGGLHVRSSYDFSAIGNYFEANGDWDINVSNMSDLVGERRIAGGRIWGNQCESQNNCIIHHGDDIHVASNRFSHQSWIMSGAVRTIWGRQNEMGSLSNYSTTTTFDTYP